VDTGGQPFNQQNGGAAFSFCSAQKLAYAYILGVRNCAKLLNSQAAGPVHIFLARDSSVLISAD